MAKGLKIAEPPQRRATPAAPSPQRPKPVDGEKFAQVPEDAKVQFNKRISRGVADGYEIMAIRLRKKVPELLAEGLELLEERYGKI